MACALLALIYLFVVFVIYALNLIAFPFDYDQGEGFELWNAVLFSRSRAIYNDNEVYPFYSSLYGPVYPLLTAPLVAVFGPHLWVGRSLTFLVTLGIGVLAAVMIHRETGDRLMAAAGALLFWASNFVYQIGPLFRQHMTMVLFGFLGVIFMGLAADASDDRRMHRRIWLSLICLLLAGYTKQLSLDAILASFAFLFLRRPRWAVVYAVVFAAAAALIFLALNLSTGGNWYTNIITANANPFVPGQAEMFYTTWLRLHWIITMLAVGYLLYTVYLDRLSIYSLFFVAAVAVGAISGKWGAGLSYFVDAVLAAAVGTCIGLARMRRWLKRQTGSPSAAHRDALAQVGLAAWGVSVPLLLAGQAALNWHMPLDHPLTRPVANILGLSPNDDTRFRAEYYDTMGYTQIGHLTTLQDIAAGWRIVEAVRKAPGPAFSEEAMFAILAGKVEVVTDPLVLYNLYVNGNLDPAPIVELIEEQTFGVVVFRARFYPLPVLQAVEAHYVLAEQIEMNGFVYDILLPRRDN
jgi:hypothetical protein